MTFPAVTGTPASNSPSTSSTSRAIVLPTGITAGEKLIAAITVGGTTAVTFTAPAGWTKIAEVSSLTICGAVFERIADGTEGSFVTATTSAAVTDSVACCYRVSGADPAALCSVATNSGFSATPDPPSQTAPWGAADTLAIAITGKRASATLDSYPSGYTANQVTGTVNNVRTAMATKTTTAATEDPGTFGLGTSVGWWTATVLVKSPAASGAAFLQLF